jgi:signal transduction histidine kinase
VAPGVMFLDGLEARIAVSPRTRRLVAILLLLVMGWIDYVTGPDIASAPFYIAVLLTMAFFEPWWICLIFSGMAALFFLGVDLLTIPGRTTLIYPYWSGFARLLSFVLISVTTSLLISERRRLRQSEHALWEKTQELEAKNRTLEDAMRELERLQGNLVRKERQAAATEAVYKATHALERPLVSISVYVEELLRLFRRIQANDENQSLLDEMQPLLEKVEERTHDLEAILKNIADLRKLESD